MCDTRAAFAERKIQSLEKYTTVTWKILDMSSFTYCLNSSQLWNPEKFVQQSSYKKIKNSDILSILYNKPLRENRKPK